jgi:2-phosphosulfolactate phosphatase
MANLYAQAGFRAGFDWGQAGAASIGPGAAIVAVVDVLSFTTTLSVAVDHGIEVFPYRWRDDTGRAYARRHNAVLAIGRSQAAEPHEVSLSPASIRRSSGIDRLVLPSPNGSTISAKLAAAGSRVIGVSLRNADAAAAWTAGQLSESAEAVVAVIAAGERWADGSLRPGVEDLWGAGAFLAGLAERGIHGLSPRRRRGRRVPGGPTELPDLLTDCASGRN